MYAILGEGTSDVETLMVLVRRLAGDPSLRVKARRFNSCGELLKKVRRELDTLAALGCMRFVISYDADGPDPKPHLAELCRAVSDFNGSHCCLLVPVQELEAWILADIEAVTKEFTGWKPEPISNPENIASPREHLARLSRDGRTRPRYNHATDNARIARHIDCEIVAAKCGSFRPLLEFIRGAGPK